MGINGTSYASSTVAPTNAGQYEASASFAGDAGHSGSSSFADFTIDKAASTTTTVGDGPFTYDGTTHSGGSGTVTGAGGLSTGATSLTYTGDQVNAGAYYVTAHYAGDADHLPSDGSAVAITINQANAIIHVTGYSVTYDGAAHTATGAATGVNNANLSGGLVLGGTTHTAPGAYSDAWSFHDAAGNYADANGTVTDNITAVGLTIRGDVYVLNRTASGAR